MKTRIGEILDYYIRYENLARFIDYSPDPSEVEGQTWPEEDLFDPVRIRDVVREYRKKHILRELGTTNTNDDIEQEIDKFLNDEIGLEAVLDRVSSDDTRPRLKNIIETVTGEMSLNIGYPLLARNWNERKPKLYPVVTFQCLWRDVGGLEVTSFVVNRNALEIFAACSEQCEVQEVGAISAKKCEAFLTEAEAVRNADIRAILDQLDRIWKRHFPDAPFNRLVEFYEYEKWRLVPFAFVTLDKIESVSEPIFRRELTRLADRINRRSSQLLENYVLGNTARRPYSPEESIGSFHYGSYTSDYPLNQKQWEIISIIPKVKILSVSGPPGTGKTTLLKELIADFVVRKAMELMRLTDRSWEPLKIDDRTIYRSPLKGKNPFSLIISSTNNRAVDNIGQELLREISYFPGVSSNPDFKGIFCARLGRKENIDQFSRECFDRLINELQKTDDNAATRVFEEVVSSFNSTFQELKSLCETLVEHERLREQVRQRESLREPAGWKEVFDRVQIAVIEAEAALKEVERQLQDHEERLQRLMEQIAAVLQEEEDGECTRTECEAGLRQAYKDLNYWNSIKRFPNRLLNVLPSRRRFLAANPSDSYLLDVRIRPLQQRLLQTEERLRQIRSTKTALERRADEMREEQKRLTALRNERSEQRNERLQRLELVRRWGESAENIARLLEEPEADRLPYYRLVNAKPVLSLRKRLFDLALRLIEAYIRKHREPIVANLRAYGDFYSEHRKKEKQKNLYRYEIHLWETFFLCFPVVTTTLHSFSEQRYPLLAEWFDTLLIDEAGQILPHYLCAPLYRARRAIIVGDTKQLEPVRTLAASLVETDHQDISILQNSAMDYAGRATDRIGVMLTEHRRCERSIMSFSNRYVYEEKLELVKPDRHDKLFGANLVAFDIRGLKDASKHHNHAEVSACKRIVRMLADRYGPDIIKDIGIITPFAHQKKLLEKVCPGVEAGTVHTFQGREKKIILFSSVIDGRHAKNRSLADFVGGSPYLLNVAFSRAKEQLIWVGNVEAIEKSDNYLAKALGEIRRHGVLYSLYSPEQEANVRPEQRAEAYRVYDDEWQTESGPDTDAPFVHSAEQHYRLLLQTLENSRRFVGIVSPWIGAAVVDDRLLSVLKAAKMRGVDVRVVFGYRGGQGISLENLRRLIEVEYEGRTDGENAEQAIQALRDCLGHALRYRPPLHVKLMLVDSQVLWIGSHNWLSNRYGKSDEISYRIRDKDAIEYVKSRYFSDDAD
ncbi:MAG: hypothetical protein BLM47_05690 [Candidatus Reconcilbacillus cellulovorans]|uniref:PLD phosphodiesterase domain-containing protein n=1 Tax=Candidatus Reconcilbacillus cellulovorans TaxID=1906605 RepID=A0A2A6E0N9_9BACL|nr:MAG: hypothetical protein BLM47_05690 [Candidatus Reconcilbacillus cellulovorans]